MTVLCAITFEEVAKAVLVTLIASPIAAAAIYFWRRYSPRIASWLLLAQAKFIGRTVNIELVVANFIKDDHVSTTYYASMRATQTSTLIAMLPVVFLAHVVFANVLFGSIWTAIAVVVADVLILYFLFWALLMGAPFVNRSNIIRQRVKSDFQRHRSRLSSEDSIPPAAANDAAVFPRQILEANEAAGSFTPNDKLLNQLFVLLEATEQNEQTLRGLLSLHELGIVKSTNVE
ncbi:MAG: hypothetical protein AAGK78_03265 [Planctomycetota bacterium]